MEIVLVINFARSGGTLFSRILRTDEKEWLLSEINPICGATPTHDAVSPELAVAQQVQSWYGIEIKHTSLISVIREFADQANSFGKLVVVRDWTYQNFMPSPQNHGKPSFRFEMLDLLSRDFNVRPFAFVRDAIDVYLSMGGDLYEFAEHYHRYVNSLVELNIPVLKYEDLIAEPDIFCSRLSDRTSIKFEIKPEKYKAYPATGDLQLGRASRGIRAKGIALMPRKRVRHSQSSRIDKCSMLMEANRILGYPETYQNSTIESLTGMFIRKVKNRLMKT